MRDRAQPEPEESLQSMAHPVTPGYFTMLGAPLRYGRDFVAADNNAEPSVAVINAHTAMEVFRTENPVGQTLVLTVIGLGIGIGGALALSSLMESLVWGIHSTDPLTFVGVTVVLAAAALAACFFPAYKASRADPLQTLRAE